MKRVVGIEIVEDRTAGSTCEDGFLRLRRLRVRSRFDDGTLSPPYACDVMTREHTDAVAVALWARDPRHGVSVLLRASPRPPVALRAGRTDLVQPAEPALVCVPEIVAGMLERRDEGAAGLRRRVVLETREEAGLELSIDAVQMLGGAFFPSPGVTDERVHLAAAEVDPTTARAPTGDGSVMEQGGHVFLLPLDEAIHRCRTGAVPDAKTEIALLRLCDLLGYSPHHGAFWADLPEAARPPAGRTAWLGGSPPTVPW